MAEWRCVIETADGAKTTLEVGETIRLRTRYSQTIEGAVIETYISEAVVRVGMNNIELFANSHFSIEVLR